MRILNMSSKLLYNVCEQNGNTNIQALHKKSVWWNRGLLVGHVVDESEECLHIWVKAHGESVDFTGRGVRVKAGRMILTLFQCRLDSFKFTPFLLLLVGSGLCPPYKSGEWYVPRVLQECSECWGTQIYTCGGPAISLQHTVSLVQWVNQLLPV
jgi:hypothetical protein